MVQPGFVAGTLGNMSPELFASLRNSWEAMNNRWNQWVLNYSRGQQLEVLKNLGYTSPSWEDLALLMASILSTAALLGAVWAWFDRLRIDPWVRQLGRIRKSLRSLGVDAAGHEPPRLLAGRCGPAWARPASRWRPCSSASTGNAMRAAPRPTPTDRSRATSRPGRARCVPWHRDNSPMPASRLRRRLLIAASAAALPALAAAKTPPKKQASEKTSTAKSAGVVDDAAPDLVTYGSRDDVTRFAAEAAARRGLDPAWVSAALGQARYIPSVARYIMPPPTGSAKNWAAYRARFVEPVRIRTGTAFWRANAKWLDQAEALYGVPPEIVVAIVGVESIYGQQMGNFRVIDALATLAFDFPKGRKDRSDFFRDELEQWFVLCKSEGVDPLAWRGSYAGAIGMAQFMPSSFNKYAVDLDGDGHVDCTEAAPTWWAASPTTWPSSAGSGGCRPTSRPRRPPR